VGSATADGGSGWALEGGEAESDAVSNDESKRVGGWVGDEAAGEGKPEWVGTICEGLWRVSTCSGRVWSIGAMQQIGERELC